MKFQPSPLFSLRHVFNPVIGATVVAIGLMGTSASAANIPKKKPTLTKKTTSKIMAPVCDSVYVIDNTTGIVLENNHGDKPRALASLTKLWTVAGALIALKSNEPELTATPYIFRAPNNLKAGQILHDESCTPRTFPPGENVREISLTPEGAIHALLAVSANPVSHPLTDRLKKIFKVDSFHGFVRKVLEIAKINQDSVRIIGEDPSGMNSAAKCNRGITKPEDRPGHQASMKETAQLFNFIFTMIPDFQRQKLMEPIQDIGGLVTRNTNPFLGYPGTEIIAKTGSVNGLSTVVFRASNSIGDITAALSCNSPKARWAMGTSTIGQYLFKGKPLPPRLTLDFPNATGDSRPNNSVTSLIAPDSLDPD